MNQDDVENARHVRQHFVVPEADYAEALPFEIACSLFILRPILVMLAAVGFDDEVLFQA